MGLPSLYFKMSKFSINCCALLCVHSSFAIILMGKRELFALFVFLSSWCLVIVVWLLLTVPRACLLFVIVVFLDHTHYLCHEKLPFENSDDPDEIQNGQIQRGTWLWSPLENHKWLYVTLDILVQIPREAIGPLWAHLLLQGGQYGRR